MHLLDEKFSVHDCNNLHNKTVCYMILYISSLYLVQFLSNDNVLAILGLWGRMIFIIITLYM